MYKNTDVQGADMNNILKFQKYFFLLILFTTYLIILNSLLVVPASNSDDRENTNLDTRTTPSNILPPAVNDDTVIYAIICPENLSSALEPLVNWKTQKGVPAKIYTTNGPDGIYLNFTNGDNATKIHEFLDSLHENNTDLQWLLLVGDEDLIPSRRVFVNASELYGLDDFYYTDHYYAGLNNSWDQDGDGIYGEQKGDVNWQADLYVGRLPVNNIGQTEMIVNRIIKYETSPVLGTWLKNATLWSGLLDGPNNETAYQAYKDNAKKVTDKIISILPEYMNVNLLYDYDELEPGNYTFENDILDHKKARESYYSGNSILSFAGQAYYTGDELAHYLDITGKSAAPDGFGSLFSYNDARFAVNGEKLPLVYLSTCSVDFSETDDSNLEQLLTSPSGGAIGLIGNTGKSYRGETLNGSSYGNWWLNEHFWRLFFNDTAQPGKCLYQLKEKYVWDVIRPGVPYIEMAVANLVGYNLLGDPEINIWTDEPKTMIFNFSLVTNDGYKLGITVNDRTGEPVENALVCVYSSSEYQYTRTTEAGLGVLDLDPRTTGELQITITANNHLPLSSNLTYLNQAPEFGIINDIIMDEDKIMEDYIDLRLYVNDPDTNFEDLEFNVLDISDSNITVRIDSSKNLDVLPYLNWFGEANVILQVFDGIDSDETSFNITVKNVNDPPEINDVMENQDLKVGDYYRYKVIASDIDDNELKFSDNTDLFNINEKTGEIKYKALEGDVGEHEISIFVSDGNASTTMTFKITVRSESSFLEEWSVPLIIIIGAAIVIISIRLYAITHHEKSEETKKSDKEKSDSAKKDNIKTKKKTNKKKY
jgi:hypothetical protein